MFYGCYCHAKDKVEELSNIGLKTFAIGTGEEEVIDEGATTGGDRTVGESFGFCCPGVEPGLVLIIKDKVEELSNTGIKTFCIDRCKVFLKSYKNYKIAQHAL